MRFHLGLANTALPDVLVEGTPHRVLADPAALVVYEEVGERGACESRKHLASESEVTVPGDAESMPFEEEVLDLVQGTQQVER